MKDMKKMTKKSINKSVVQPEVRIETEEAVCEELDRSCKPKVNHDHECKKMHCECECECSCKPSCKPNCEPCQLDAENCIDNTSCGPECCSPIAPPRFSPANSVPFAIEANRIYDTMQFQTFTDALGENGEPLSFDYEVVEVRGPVPRGGQVNVVIEKICLNYSSITIDPGTPSLEDYDVEPIENVKPCETTFDYAVCADRNSNCSRQGRGQRVVYKQKGIVVTVEDLVLELRGKCGCTEIIALAYPSTKPFGSQRTRCEDVEFIFNTLSAPICLPSDGRGVTLRQSFQTNLTVDCIGKALLKYVGRNYCDDCCGHDGYYELCIPNDIDLICCLQLVVSILTNEQIVVLGAPQGISPRVVDTFSKVCDFGDQSNTNNQGNCGCGC